MVLTILNIAISNHKIQIFKNIQTILVKISRNNLSQNS